MSDTQPIRTSAGRWKRPLYVLLVVAALAMVMFAWLHTPTAQRTSYGAENETLILRCANAGPSRWDPPTVSPGQELSSDPAMQTHNQHVLKNDIESLRVEWACEKARDRHTNTLIVATFGAGVVLFLGYAALWGRRDRSDPQRATELAHQGDSDDE